MYMYNTTIVCLLLKENVRRVWNTSVLLKNTYLHVCVCVCIYTYINFKPEYSRAAILFSNIKKAPQA